MNSTSILMFLFDQYTALDIIGPYEVFTRLPGVKISFVGEEKRAYKDSYGLSLTADYPIDEVSHGDILFIPGGFGIDKILSNKRIIEWVRKIDLTSKWTISDCAGALLLAEAGLLSGKVCTTHWRRKEQLRKYDCIIKNERYVQDGKIVTAAGVSAGIDMALYLVSKIAGEKVAKIIQLGIEYDPQPPFDCGTPDKAPKEILEMLKANR